MELKPAESVILLSPGKDDDIAESAGDILRQQYGVNTIQEGYDILTDEGSIKVAERISGPAPFAGMVITLPRNGPGKYQSMEDVSRLLRGVVLPIAAFLASPAG